MNAWPAAAHKQAPGLDASRRLVERLPITMRPALNQQLSQWNTLFPFEQAQIAGFLRGVESLSPTGLAAIDAPLWTLEKKMGVKDWNFSQANDTIENASTLARSQYYGEWRREVQKVFEAVNAASRDSTPAHPERTRMILIVLPRSLPVDPQSVWRQWDPRGHPIRISADSGSLCELLLQGQPGVTGIAALAAQQGSADSSDLWLIDAEAKLGSLLPPGSPVAASFLGFAALKPFRDRFLAELNKAPKSIRVTDEIVNSLRVESWDGWGLWPAEIAGQPRLRKFVIDLFLSGNGALIFSNAFVEWAVCEALRRARPRTIVARFGMRSKPKPFTSIAVFENQQKVSSLPDVDDPDNSAIDAVILARYIWLAAARYPEQQKTLCLCVSEHLDSGYLILPAGNSLGWSPDRSITPEELSIWLGTQLVS
jgi:hypothetical protein